MNKNNFGREEFNIQNCTVAYVQFYGRTTWEICFIDSASGDIVENCTSEIPDKPLDSLHVLIKDDFVEVLTETGVVRPTGEVLETERDGKLHLCDVPAVPMQWAHDIVEARKSRREFVAEPIQAERDLDDRDLADEIEL